MEAILVDDEQLALDFLELQIKKVSKIKVVGKYIHFDLKRNSDVLSEIDIVFLDIDMPEVNGLELAEMLLEENPSLVIVFVTAYNDYAVQAFELNALDYVLKPVRTERLQKTLERIEQTVKNSKFRDVSTSTRLRIHLFRELTFQLDQNKHIHIKWRTTKAQELFLYLLQHAERTNNKSELIELLWPEFDTEKAFSQLYTAIYHIRKALKPYEIHFSLKNMQDGYLLSLNNAVTDVFEWEEKMRTAPPIQINSIDKYEAIMQLYTGSYLQKYNYLWTEPERYRLEQIWLKAAYDIANIYYDHGYLENAESWYVQICTLRPEDEHAHFSLMQLYASMGYGLLVKHQYDQLKSAMKEFHIKMNPTIQKWYNRWNRDKVK